MSTATTTVATAAQQDAPKQDATTKVPTGATTPPVAPQIAVVDEDVWRVRHLSELLQKNGFRVLLLTSPGNAVQLVDARCDVVLIAQQLKGLPADELGRSLREKHGDKRPWLVMLGDDENAARASFDGAVALTIGDDALVARLIEAVVARRASVTVPVAAPDADALET